ncbi:alkyl/aryl-sulfatase [Desulfovibrio sp. OttesenSCG-928-C06]|nr:alkyl/aryl-sulfatase [Desulfovibrio sp. OttesenSCG-928-C06]
MSKQIFAGFEYPAGHKHRLIERKRYEVAPGVHVFYGYSGSNFSAIIGPDGWILVDTGSSVEGAKMAVEEIATLTDKPLAAIIMTHSHPDHRGGGAVFLEGKGADFPVWGRSNFGAEMAGFKGLEKIAARRGGRQFGAGIPDSKYTPNVMVPRFDYGETPGAPFLPTRFLDGAELKLDIAGVRVELYAAPGETQDHMAVWLPGSSVLFTGDNMYRSFPNIYPVRGAGFRDLGTWAATLRRLADFPSRAVVFGHNEPVCPGCGQEDGPTMLRNYAEAIQFVLDASLGGINDGLTPDELAASLRLPEHLRQLPYLGEFYGSVPWAVRSVFAGMLGWFDGNASNLVTLQPKDEAARMAELAGGAGALLGKAKTALESGDYPWAAKLADYVRLCGSAAEISEASLLKADALEKLSEIVMPISGKNYLIASALELRAI